MSQYERRRRSNVLSGDGSRLPNGGNTRVGRRGSGHLAAFSVCLGGRLDKTGTHANDGSRGEAVGKPGVAGVYTNQRLNLSKPWEDLRMTSQGFKPGSGNPTVRHYRGALGNVRHGETETPSCNRKSGNGNPSPTAGRAQFLSQPAAAIQPGTAALFVLAHKVTGDKVLEGLKGEGGTLLKTSLDHTKEAALQAALAGVQAAIPSQPATS